MQENKIQKTVREFEHEIKEKNLQGTQKRDAWIHAMRLRTLPLSLSGIGLGASAASMAGVFSYPIFFFSMLTGVILQILSNFANDYGDAKKGADGRDRVGPMRTVSSGLISQEEMLFGIKFCILLTFISTVLLLFVSFGTDITSWLIFLTLAIASILAALGYTMGKNPYGYSGKGDIFVFIFFGLVSVLGSYALYGGDFYDMPILPALSSGLFSTAVLNVNNIRDMKSDERHGKMTFALSLGEDGARKYHLMLIVMGFLFWIAYLLVMMGIGSLVLLIFALPIAYSTYIVYTSSDSNVLDKQLKITAMGTGIFHLLISLILPFL